MLADPTERDTTVRELARTYNPPGYADPYDCVQDYRRVQRYTAEHPRQGSQAVSSAVNLPRERIRGWVDSDARPDCVHAIETAEAHGWLIDDWTSPVADGLNTLAAWLLASGSLTTETYQPHWIANDNADRLRESARAVDVTLTRQGRDDGRPPEWVPREDGVVLGRLLHLWTGLRGDKSSDATRFPRYPEYVPKHVARHFAQVYVENRAIERSDTTDRRLQIQEHRNPAYREQLVALLQRVVTDPSHIRGDSWPIYIVDDAVGELALRED